MRRLGLLLLAGLFAQPASAAEIKVGVLAFRGAEHAAESWQPTLEHLRSALPEHQFRLETLDLAGMTASVAAGKLDFVITNPGSYIELESAFGASRIATVDAGLPHPDRAVGSAVIARADRSDLTRLSDLSGQRLMAAGQAAFGGFRVAWREMAEQGLDPFADTKLSFAGFPLQKIVHAVRDGQADAGIVRTCLIEEMEAEGLIAPGVLKVVAPQVHDGFPCASSTRLYPDWPFAKAAHTSPELAKQVVRALLDMPMGAQPHGLRQGWTVPVDYQPVHELFRALKLGPYGVPPTVAEFVAEHWHWLAFLAAALLWWVVHVARVEHLVRQRTIELRTEMEERRRAQDELQHVAKLSLLGEMASNLAHELNQPLAAIANYARGVARHLKAGAEEAVIEDGVRRIAEQAERAGGVVHRIRAFARRREAIKTLTPVNELVAEALDLFVAANARLGVAVETRLAADLPPILADRIQVQQILLNLLQNASDAMQGQHLRRVLVTTSALPEGGIAIAVRDHGPGLDPQAATHLFEPFFSTKPEGLGLGLALSRSFAEAHGGRLWAEPADGGGAVFTFTLSGAS